jgi:uncharacterized protein (TIGR02597 family)
MRLVITLACILLAQFARAQLVVADNFNVTGSGTGFGLNSGVNSGINPPTTRLTGTAAANLRYIPTTTRASSTYSITSNKVRVTSDATAGRFVLSADGVTPFNFASSLGTAFATPQSPVVYDLSISMKNSSTGVARMSFGFGTAEGDATTWDFGIQLFATADSDSFYTIGKRIDIKASGLSADINTFITNTAPGTFGTEVPLLMRVTDAGSESASFNSRVQLSLDGGFTWFYDTAVDPDLPNGWRLNGSGRYAMCDIAPNAGPVTYDDFSIKLVPVSATLVSPNDNAKDVSINPQLNVAVGNKSADNVTVTYYARQAGKPFPGPDFMIAVLPDTQNYARENSAVGDAKKEMWFAQTEWIITNRVASNIVYAVQLGDCVNDGDIFNGGNNTTQWRNATNAMWRLESRSRTLLNAGIPYGVVVGNHDQEPNGDPDGTTINYNLYFGENHWAGKPYYGGHFSTNNDSWFNLFSGGGLDFIVLSFEYDRYGSTILQWAQDVLATNQNRRVIVAIHNAGTDATPVNTSAQGQAIYDALKVNTNFFLMLGGHHFANDGEGSRSDTYQGRTVRTYVSDYQGRTNGGDGLMRLMRFSPSNNLVTITTYSPWTGQYETDADSQMSFPYNMQPNGDGVEPTPCVAVATNAGAAPGSTNTFLATALQTGKTYEWYAKVTDSSGISITTPTRSFTTVGSSSISLSLPGNSDSYISLPFVRPATATTTVASASGNNITTTASWTPGQFVYSAGVQTNTYYARVLTGAAAGGILPIVTNTATILTVTSPYGSPASIASGDRFSIEPYWTLATVFPNGAGINVSPTSGNRNTEILLPDSSSTGINLSVTAIYYFNAGIWKQVGKGNSNVNDTVLPPNAHFVVRHNVATSTTLTLSGAVVSPLAVPLVTSPLSRQDNALGLARPVAVTLDASQLISSGAFASSPLPGTRTDELLTFDDTVVQKNKSSSAVYYFWSGAWRRVGSGALDVGSTPVFTPGTGVIIRKNTNSTAPTWTTTSTW